MTLITFVTRVHFADRVLEDALAEEMARLGIDRPLVLVDADAGDEVDRLIGRACPSPRRPFASRSARRSPADAALREAAALFTETQCDGIVGCGGARTLDMARLLGGAGGAGRRRRPRGRKAWDSVRLPSISPGTGRGRPSRPSAILCDATLTVGADPAAAAAAGMDALVHCLEAYLSSAYNPPADGIALEGLRRAALNLERAVACGELSARRELLAAALNGGLASQKGFGGIEAGRARARGGSGRAARRASRGAAAGGAGVQQARHRGSVRGAARGARAWRAATTSPAALTRLAERVGLPVAAVGGRHLRRAFCPVRRRARRRTRRTGRTRAMRRTGDYQTHHGGRAVTTPAIEDKAFARMPNRG